MASYLDSVPNFNPYIQQLPIEAMMAVGMEKQQLYDKGVERIQSQIDQVGGLNIARPQDRQYLQSKLDELGSKLKTVAAADFSNNQLVNSIGGMTSNIARDQNVISSVQSTAQRKALQERKQKDIEAGKYNPANDTMFNISDQEWFNNPNVGAKYTGYYKTPHDVWAKVKDIAKEVGVDSKELDNLFERDTVTGEIKRDKNGNPLFDEMLFQKTLKGKDPAKLLSAFQSALTPADYEQLSIEGRYKYLNSTPEQLQEKILNPLNEKIEFNNGRIELLKIALNSENNKDKKNPESIDSLSKQIEYFETQNSTFKKSQKDALASLATNPDSVKAMLHTNDYLSSMSKILSSEEISTKYSVHPLFEIAQEKKTFLLNERTAQINAFYKEQENKRANRAAELNEAEKLLDIEKKRRELLGSNGSPGSPGLPQGITDIITPAQMVTNKNAEFENTVYAYNDLNKNIAIEAVKDANPRNAGENDVQYETRIAVKLKDIAKVVDPNTGSVNVAMEKIATQQLERWRTNPNNIPPTAIELITRQNDTLKTLSVLQSEMKSIKEKADQIAITKGVDTKAYEKAIKFIKPTTVEISTGESLKLSPEDLIDLVNLRPEMYNLLGSFFVDKQQSKLSSQARMKLNTKYGPEKANLIERRFYPSADRDAVSPLLSNISHSIRSSEVSDYVEILSEEMQKIGMIAEPSRFSIPQGDLKDKDYNAKFSSVLENYREVAPDVIKDLSKVVLSGKFAGNAIAYPGNSTTPDKYYMSISPESGEAPTPIEITKGEFEYLTLTQAPESSSFTGAASLLMTKRTTNLNSSGDYQSTYFTPTDFSNFESSNYTLRGDLEKDLNNPNLSYMKLYLIDKNNGNLVDKAWVKDIPFPLTLDNGSPNRNIDRSSQGFNNKNVQLIFNIPVN
jgi:hypothetical protein